MSTSRSIDCVHAVTRGRVHTEVTRATATGAKDMAIPFDPPGQGRHQRSRWSRPPSCRTRTVLVIPRSTRRAPVEISHSQGKRGNRRTSLKKETQWRSLTPAGRDKVQALDVLENLRWKGFHPTPAISAAAATLKKSQNEIGSCLMAKPESRH